ncbi:Ger(x)C family spore germination protein [Bacillus sp. FJAT-45350]|uniref:Ger(x)C family spore germination protein n=1 Tax=Bacillus sp. FJAT-45350 TaxID=2011014 RepID=UPI000BB78676|nr:Ger(x)C family spore germination protein [Bacillus sp. FJAT-45350]
MKKTIIFTLLIVLTSSFLISCWDMTEIEEIGFVMAIALDPTPNEEKKLKEIENETGKTIGRKGEHDQLFNVSFDIAIPSRIEAQEGGRTGRAFFTKTTSALTNFKAVRQLSTRSSRRLNFEHLKAIIINEELVKGKPMLEHLGDLYIRDHEMRRRTFMYITNKEARDVIDNKLPLEELIAESIVSINENHRAASSMIPPTTIGDVAINITGNNSFLIPRIIPYEGELKITGGAVFLGKENIMLGWLGEEDISGYNWVIGEAGNSIIEVQYDEDEAELFVFETITASSTVNYVRDNGKDIFNVLIRAEGSLAESWLHDVEFSDEEVIKELEEKIEKAIERKAIRILDKMQNEFQSDIFGFHKKVKQKQYPYWKTVQDNWDGENSVFQEAEINVKTSVKIRHYMLNEVLE